MAAKIFEVNDVLPATTQLRISWGNITAEQFFDIGWYKFIKTQAGDFILSRLDYAYGGWYFATGFLGFYDEIGGRNTILHKIAGWDDDSTYGWYSGYGPNSYCDIDTSTLSEAERTITYRSPSTYLYWEDLAPAPSGYTITFNSNGGTTIPDIEEATELPTPLPTPTKSGYTFVNWYYESNFQTRAKAGDTIESNVTLYAKWHNLGTLFTGIANAIRSKDGTSGNIRDLDFDDRIRAIEPAKEEQTKTVSPTTSSQDVLPDANKVLSKVTVNAIPTETKSQQPNLSSGDQTINATSGKFMTSFTITKDTINHIASNIRSGTTLYGVTGNLQPAKEEETKTVTPNFSSGNVVVTPTSGKVLSQVTINKDSNLIAENIKKDVTVHGITGTLESGGGGYSVVLFCRDMNNYSSIIDTLQYSLDDGSTWIDITRTHYSTYEYIQDIIQNVTTIKFRASCMGSGLNYINIRPRPQSGNVLYAAGGYGTVTSNNITLTDNQIYKIELYED